MKTLVSIDVGNTQTKVGFFQKKKLVEVITFNTRLLPKNSHLITRALKNYKTSETLIALCSVVPTVSKKIFQLFKKRNIVEVNTSANFPFKVHYKTPKTLGADRLCLAAFGWKKITEKPTSNYESSIIISIGTSSTIEVINRKKGYLGGLIFPAPQLSLFALSQATELLPKLSPKKTSKILGKTTEDCMIAGTYINFIGGIKHAVSSLENKLNQRSIIIFCGGNHHLISKNIFPNNRTIFEPHAVIKGLNFLFLENALKI